METKICNCCKEEKLVNEFSIRPSAKRQGKVQYYSQCKKCITKKRNARRRKKNPEKENKRRKNNTYRYKYGITLLDYEEMYRKQEGRCLVCGDFYESLNVDHCHTTNIVRGLLCGSCNGGLGLFRDNSKFLEAAILYLRITGTDKSSTS